MEIIDLTSFEKALNSLKEVIEVYDFDKTNLIKRFFSQGAFVLENIEGMTFNEMIRQANKMDLLRSNLEKWDDFRQKRNLTSHTYDEEVAVKVVSIIADFAKEAEFLLKQLKEKTK